jgi:alcohol dehydrogenase class IV
MRLSENAIPMTPFDFTTTATIVFGAGAIHRIGGLATARLGARVLIVTDKGIESAGLVAPVQESLTRAGVAFAVFEDVVADPTEAVVHAAAAAAVAFSADGVIGLGGGSALDAAKLAALLAVGRERLEDIYGVGNVKGPRLPLLLVPTTSGTGSEVTPIAVVTTAASDKMGVVTPVILPDIALLDPSLTHGLPPHITAATGIDAMVHAIEASTSLNPNNNPVSRALAREALRLMGGALEKAVKQGDDADARSDMMLGSMLAGQAFANSPVAAVHALAYPIGGHFHVPHGLSNALVLPHVLRFNTSAAGAVYADIAVHAFPHLAAVAERERAHAFADSLAALSKRCGLPQRLRDVGIPADAIPILASAAMRQTRLLVNNPRPLTHDDAETIYRQAW